MQYLEQQDLKKVLNDFTYTVNTLWYCFYSEPMWPIEARCAAIANSYYTVAINRVGTVSKSGYLNLI